jgi:methylated-DNA-[protein]-cysteine S-methyltransferase
MAATLSVESPLGPLALLEEGGAIVSLDWGAAKREDETPLLARARAQLVDYFAGRRHDFDLPLAPRGTEFQRRVWRALARILYGETLTYGALAQRLGSAPRAVGGACGANPIPIIIPCHRVVAATGALTGYSGVGGTATKRRLLELEADDLTRLASPRDGGPIRSPCRHGRGGAAAPRGRAPWRSRE